MKPSKRPILSPFMSQKIGEIQFGYAQIKDLDQILEIQKQAFFSEARIVNDFSIPPLVQTPESLREDFDKMIFLTVYHNGKLIGSSRIYLNENTCYIGRMILKEQYQGNGIGKQLLTRSESVFTSAQRFELFTGAKSARNIHIYTSSGYKIFKTENLTDQISMVFLEKYS